MTKRIYALVLVVLMSFTVFYGCGKNDSQANKNDYTDIYNYGEDYFRNIGERTALDFDSPNYIYNDFSDGIDDRFSLVTGIWGNDGHLKHQGVQSDNIYLTTDGNLAIKINGDYYRGEGVGNTNGIRTGGTLVSDYDMGPGRFEVKMKAGPRSGICSAYWTYQFDSGNPAENGWNEIDIEILGGGSNGSFDSIWYTTWQNATKPNTRVADLETVRMNDDIWHIHTFDWYTDYMGTGKGRIDWFIDGKLVYWTDKSVALKSGNLWLGSWRPSEFAGNSKFETAWMLAEWMRYTPFMDQEGWIETGYRSQFNSYNKKLAHEKITITDEMLNQRLANPGFENVDTEATVPTRPFKENINDFAAVGWLKKKIREDECLYEITNDAKSGKNALKVTSGAVEQEIEGAFAGYKYNLKFYGKKFDDSDGSLILRYYTADGSMISEEVLKIDSNDYKLYEKQLTMPEDCGKLRISLRKGIFDDMTCLYTGRNI